MTFASTRCLAPILAIALSNGWNVTARAEDYAARMTRGKLQADLGNYEAARGEFAAIAAAESAPKSLRGEAQVRLGLAQRALGDDLRSVESFQKAMTSYRDERDVLWLLVQAVGGVVPGRERWDEIWRQVRLEVEQKDPAHPRVVVLWPATSRHGEAAVALPLHIHTGAGISLDLRDGDILETFRMFADVTSFNVVVYPGVHGRVTIRASDTPWDEVLEQILAVNGYTYRVEGNVLRVASPEELGQPRTYTGKPIDVDFREEPLESAFRQLAASGGLGVEVGPGVAGSVTLLMKDVKWDQAFDIVASVNGLSWLRKNGLLRVAQPGT